MNISLRWLNSLLDPGTLNADEAEAVLMGVGFPIESRTDVPGPDGGPADVRLDIEITSNRGDCLSHVGLAREVAAKTGRRLRAPDTPAVPPAAEPASALVTVDNRDPHGCPLFTARVILGVTVGPSPAWLRSALESIGQRSINGVVDVTNYVSAELGNPCHVFDHAKLAGGAIVVRSARDGEALTTLDGKPRTLRAGELVVADAERAQGLAGVMGGRDSEVGPTTTDVVLEMATWDPATVRRAARRHGLRTDASHRYERIVDARTLDAAADRAARLIAQVGGGRLCPGSVVAGGPLAAPTRVRFRPERCDALLGVHTPVDEVASLLSRLGIEVGGLGRSGGELLCTIPPWRADLTREVDLIEEVARVRGLDAITLAPKLAIAVRGPQPAEAARREVASTLLGLGFYETVTVSFASTARAAIFLDAGLETVAVDDDRRKEEPVLRPSVLTGLLASRRANANAGTRPDGGVRLFETASAFAQRGGATAERRTLTLLMDVPGEGRVRSVADRQRGVRLMRGALEAVTRALGGAGATLALRTTTPTSRGFEPGAHAAVFLAGAAIGSLGLLSAEALAAWDLDLPLVGAEVEMGPLLALYPPKTRILPPPGFPPIERDVSVVVGDAVGWEAIEAAIGREAPARLETTRFVGTYRGKQVGAGRKSVTLRLTFRDPDRTLRNDEIDPPVAAVVAALAREFKAELRA